MRTHRLILSALLFVCCAGYALAQDPAPVAHPEQLGFAPDRLKRITDTYQGYVDRGDLPGAVLLIARDDKVAYFQAIGFQDREKKIAMQRDAVFRLASMTKPIVSVAAMMLAEEGRLDLVAPVSTYLPEFKDLKVAPEQSEIGAGAPLSLEPQRRAMTVQDLLRHTSGLVYPNNGDGPVYRAWQAANVSDRGQSLAEMVTKMAKLPLAHQPGKVWEYSMSVDVLGRVVEVVSGKDLDAFVAERIAGPLGMKATDFYVHESDLPRLAEAQAPAPGSDARMPPDVTRKPRWFSGGGGMVASAADYLRFAEMLLHQGASGDTRLLAPHTVELMTANALPPDIGYNTALAARFGDIAPTPEMGQGFGLGFCVRVAEGRNPLPGSIGNFYWTGAWGTTFWVDPKERLIAIQMIQTPASAGGPYRRAFRNLVYQALTGA